MFGKRGSPAAGSRLLGLLLGVALVLCVPQAATAAEQAQGPTLLARGAGYGTTQGSGSVEALQRRLTVLGESPGPVDGLFGPLTEGAVRRLQERTGLAVDGIVGPATRKALRTAQPRPLRRGAGYGVPGGSAQVKVLQRRLRAAGQRVGPIDGKFGPQTELAVNSLQAKNDLVVDGVAGPRTYAVLDRLHGEGSRNVKDGSERRGSDGGRATSDERRASAERPEQSPPQQPEPAKPVAETTGGEGGGGDVPWLPIGIAVGLIGVAALLFVFRNRLPRRKPPTSVVPLGRGLELEGESRDPSIGRFRGTAYAVEIPEVKDPGERATGSRFFVLDPGRRLPFWVDYSEVETPLPPALQAHPGPWAGQRGLRPGTPVLGYVTVPRSVPGRQAELYDQLGQIEGLCRRRKFELLGVVRDVEPEGDNVLERPGVRYALERFASEEASALVVSDVQRLASSREQLDALLARLAEQGIALVALEPELDTSTPEGREVVRQLEIVREERAKLGGGTRSERKAKSRAQPAAPAENPEPDPLRERILELRDQGESLQAIADALNADEVPPPGGFKWRARNVRTALESAGGDPGGNVVPLNSPRFQRSQRQEAERDQGDSEGPRHAGKGRRKR